MIFTFFYLLYHFVSGMYNLIGTLFRVVKCFYYNYAVRQRHNRSSLYHPA